MRMVIMAVAFATCIAMVGYTGVSIEEEPVSITIEMITEEEMIDIGDVVTLHCDVSGVQEPYIIRWQYTDDPEQEIYYDIDYAGEEYSFILTEENIDYFYRVLIVVSSDDEVIMASR